MTDDSIAKRKLWTNELASFWSSSQKSRVQSTPPYVLHLDEPYIVRHALWMLMGIPSSLFQLCTTRDCTLHPTPPPNHMYFPTNIFQRTCKKEFSHIPHFYFSGSTSSTPSIPSSLSPMRNTQLRDLPAENVAHFSRELCGVANALSTLRHFCHAHRFEVNNHEREQNKAAHSRTLTAFLSVILEEIHFFEDQIARMDRELARHSPIRSPTPPTLLSLPLLLEKEQSRIQHVCCISSTVVSSGIFSLPAVYTQPQPHTRFGWCIGFHSITLTDNCAINHIISFSSPFFASF